MVKSLTKDTFDDVIQNNALVVIDFWSRQCQPCKAFAKICAQIAPDYSDVVFASVDVDDQSELAQEFEVIAVPFVLIIRDQVIVFAESGLLTKDTLVDLLEQARQVDV